MSHREKREGRREQVSEGGREQGGGSTSGVLITSESCIILLVLYNIFYILLHININASWKHLLCYASRVYWKHLLCYTS